MDWGSSDPAPFLLELYCGASDPAPSFLFELYCDAFDLAVTNQALVPSKVYGGMGLLCFAFVPSWSPSSCCPALASGLGNGRNLLPSLPALEQLG